MKRHLMIDFKGIAEHSGVTRRMNPPEKLGPVVTQDQLWRSRLSGYYGQVMEHNGKLLMWTNCGWGDEKQFPDAKRSHGLLYGKQRYVQYLESADGLNWTSPALGAIECAGSFDNNLIYKDGMEGVILYEPKAPASERWQYVHLLRKDDERGVGISVSPDGAHWQDKPGKLFPIMGDSQNVCFFDEVLKQYVFYFRSFTGKPGTPLHGRFFAAPGEGCRERAVARVTFESLDALADAVMPDRNVIEPDALDPENLDIYTNATVRYPLADDVVLAFPSIYRKFPTTPDAFMGEGVLPHNNGILGTQLAVSRDGETFDRIREPYVTGSPVGGMDSASNYFHVGMFIRGDHILQYYWGGNHTHGGDARYAKPRPWHRNAVYALKQRIDGFCSMDFDVTGGRLLTEPFVLPEGGLHINVNTLAWGDLEATLLDAAGNPLDVQPKQEYVPLIGNYTDVEVYCTEALAPFAGQRVRLCFTGRAAKLFSYWFA